MEEFVNSGIMKGLKSLKPDIVIIDKDNTLFDNNDENNEKKENVDSGQHINNVNMESKNDEKDDDKKQLKS